MDSDSSMTIVDCSEPLLLSDCLSINKQCVWIFAPEPLTNSTAEPGRCVFFSDCSAPGLDVFNEMQRGIIEGIGVDDAWLMSSVNSCLTYSLPRNIIGTLAYVALMSLIIGLFRLKMEDAWVDDRDAAREETKSRKSNCPAWLSQVHNTSCRGKVTWLLVGSMATVLIGFSVVIAWNDAASNLLLLPSFALFALTVEALHFLPTPPHHHSSHGGGDHHGGAADDEEDGGEEGGQSSASTSTPRTFLSGAFPRWRRGEISTPYALLLLLSASILSATQAACCSIFLLGMMLQFSSSSYEAAAVRGIAWIDVGATIGHALLFATTDAGAHHFHLPSWILSTITAVFAAALMAIAVAMEASCAPDSYLTSSNTVEEFEACQNRFVGRAYALAFVSMLRQLVVKVLDATCSFSTRRSSSSAVSASSSFYAAAARNHRDGGGSGEAHEAVDFDYRSPSHSMPNASSSSLFLQSK